ncbi:hypothetical protein GLOIN_2v1567999 [Rhizophagus irregularis DAOM 181602=DAOM 197198]|uniref:Uncharacterized protein n=1 Tax=Rhizophagus irregularis (strain DAOM 181602 / DAOM 197198 / MUCL 43194) TaxID=747089 RepID=U9TVT1_RHIID|nr:hypothetical protein GLOIN_2v1567999 [Rhizophagus irregularis DAOM 181602=DAOM 197198]POG75222.1 hypothetical protein GLOIN_2v1567999 [Rhizophagus irregularis DAOM 181602=DAOM 197198]|eukprot:XP_025182088.1 hypothetical protein GLOIN_2v1567999 [Rhizophagus irregularis DAOM 181602=DAOM 197198]
MYASNQACDIATYNFVKQLPTLRILLSPFGLLKRRLQRLPSRIRGLLLPVAIIISQVGPF